MIIAAQIFAATLPDSVLYNLLLSLAKEHTSSRFVLFADELLPTTGDLPANIHFVVIQPKARNILLLHYWHNFKLPSLLKKYQVTHFISETGALSLRTTIPQYLVVTNLSFLLHKPVVKQVHASYLKRYFPKFINKATAIFYTEEFIGDQLMETYPSATGKLTYVGHGLNNIYQPMNWEEKERFLETTTEGTEYFMAECSPVTQPNILVLVKAFSLFKKRQKSSMKLLLLLRGVTKEDCIKDFHLYKYREDVKFIVYENEAQYARFSAAAYAHIYLPAQMLADNTGLNALASGTALITIQNKMAQRMYGEAALFANLTEKDLAEQMMALYKDELLRKQLIERGLALVAPYTWATTIEKIRVALDASGH
ncbi:MAG: hypothetical protein EOO13_10570 [Chitinophagaceae bacterium]|nr:MAG: hypothetical protein EOO13_10570 [Chitinophagaceae bacterium]